MLFSARAIVLFRIAAASVVFPEPAGPVISTLDFDLRASIADSIALGGVTRLAISSLPNLADWYLSGIEALSHFSRSALESLDFVGRQLSQYCGAGGGAGSGALQYTHHASRLGKTAGRFGSVSVKIIFAAGPLSSSSGSGFLVTSVSLFADSRQDQILARRRRQRRQSRPYRV